MFENCQVTIVVVQLSYSANGSVVSVSELTLCSIVQVAINNYLSILTDFPDISFLMETTACLMSLSNHPAPY